MLILVWTHCLNLKKTNNIKHFLNDQSNNIYLIDVKYRMLTLKKFSKGSNLTLSSSITESDRLEQEYEKGSKENDLNINHDVNKISFDNKLCLEH